ncbi:MAG: hypothetical protein ACXWRE_14375 [Pseudobdellovibrionaceae bacterium]
MTKYFLLCLMFIGFGAKADPPPFPNDPIANGPLLVKYYIQQLYSDGEQDFYCTITANNGDYKAVVYPWFFDSREPNWMVVDHFILIKAGVTKLMDWISVFNSSKGTMALTAPLPLMRSEYLAVYDNSVKPPREIPVFGSGKYVVTNSSNRIDEFLKYMSDNCTNR